MEKASYALFAMTAGIIMVVTTKLTYREIHTEEETHNDEGTFFGSDGAAYPSDPNGRNWQQHIQRKYAWI